MALSPASSLPASSSCTPCDDVHSFIVCAEKASEWLQSRCVNKAAWRNDGCCRLSCFLAGVGYDGDDCCVHPPPASPSPPPPTPPPPSACSVMATLSDTRDLDPPQWCSTLAASQELCESFYATRSDGTLSRCVYTIRDSGAGRCAGHSERFTCEWLPSPSLPSFPPLYESVTLYGLGVRGEDLDRALVSINTTDHYIGTSDPAPGATLIDRDMFGSDDVMIGPFRYSSHALVVYLNEQLGNGGSGQYVALRLGPAAASGCDTSCGVACSGMRWDISGQVALASLTHSPSPAPSAPPASPPDKLPGLQQVVSSQ
jgi:hypothetical protein